MRLRALLCGVAWIAAAGRAPAGGPETSILVVQGRSPVALETAREYLRLRPIPASHVLVLEDAPLSSITDLETFRRTLWEPLQAFLDQAPFGADIDLVIWTPGFPYGIRFDPSDYGEFPKYVTPVASLTGLTSLGPLAFGGDAAWLDLEHPQPAFVRARETTRALPRDLRLQGFRASVLLGWSGENGNSLPEILACLQRGREADATRPEGVVYLMRNQNVRSKTRQPFFAETVELLGDLGGRGEILDGILPEGREDVLGVVGGSAVFDWPAAGSTLLPGALAEHLTSSGAAFQTPNQTKTSAWIRAGAAGTSGTVTEPYALAQKFPLPELHVHYRRGATLAEAFHQSVASPYQLLVVGDPLCRPFASLTPPRLLEPDPQAPWPAGKVRLQVLPGEGGAPPVRFEVWIDGVRRAEGEPGSPLEIPALKAGPHELRLVAVGPAPLEERQGRTFLVQTGRRPQGPLGAPLPTLPDPAEAGDPPEDDVLLLPGPRRLEDGSWDFLLELPEPGPWFLRERSGRALLPASGDDPGPVWREAGWHHLRVPGGQAPPGLVLEGPEAGRLLDPAALKTPREDRKALPEPSPPVYSEEDGGWILRWERTQRGLRTLVLLPGPAWPGEEGWEILTRTRSGRSWRPVRDLDVLGRGVAQGRGRPPFWVEFGFRRVASVRELLVRRPGTGASAQALKAALAAR